MVGRDGAVRVVQPTLAMLHQRRHAWQRNTFRCTCCCCSQITKYPTQHVPLGCAQGTQLTHALARWSMARRWLGTRRAANLGHAAPATTCLAMKHLSLHGCCSQGYQVPGTQHVPLGCTQGTQLNARAGPIPRARRGGTRRAATLAMLHQRRHAWQRNTFRCTCCCCSQITKYPTQHVPLGCAQGTQLTRALARWSGAT